MGAAAIQAESFQGIRYAHVTAAHESNYITEKLQKLGDVETLAKTFGPPIHSHGGKTEEDHRLETAMQSYVLGSRFKSRTSVSLPFVA